MGDAGVNRVANVNEWPAAFTHALADFILAWQGRGEEDAPAGARVQGLWHDDVKAMKSSMPGALLELMSGEYLQVPAERSAVKTVEQRRLVLTVDPEDAGKARWRDAEWFKSNVRRCMAHVFSKHDEIKGRVITNSAQETFRIEHLIAGKQLSIRNEQGEESFHDIQDILPPDDLLWTAVFDDRCDEQADGAGEAEERAVELQEQFGPQNADLSGIDLTDRVQHATYGLVRIAGMPQEFSNNALYTQQFRKKGVYRTSNDRQS